MIEAEFRGSVPPSSFDSLMSRRALIFGPPMSRKTLITLRYLAKYVSNLQDMPENVKPAILLFLAEENIDYLIEFMGELEQIYNVEFLVIPPSLIASMPTDTLLGQMYALAANSKILARARFADKKEYQNLLNATRLHRYKLWGEVSEITEKLPYVRAIVLDSITQAIRLAENEYYRSTRNPAPNLLNAYKASFASSLGGALGAAADGLEAGFIVIAHSSFKYDSKDPIREAPAGSTKILHYVSRTIRLAQYTQDYNSGVIDNAENPKLLYTETAKYVDKRSSEEGVEIEDIVERLGTLYIQHSRTREHKDMYVIFDLYDPRYEPIIVASSRIRPAKVVATDLLKHIKRDEEGKGKGKSKRKK